MKWARRKMRPTALKALLAVKRFHIRNSILIVSEPRSGSTWLMEVLSNHPRTVINWEPLHPKYGVTPINVEIGIRSDISKVYDSDDIRRRLEEVLTFRRHSEWSRKFVEPGKLILADSVLTKLIRITRMLPWIVETFEFIHRPILLLRHPVAVVISQRKHFGDLDFMNIINSGNYALDAESIRFVSTLKGEYQKRLALWCISHRNVLNEQNDKWKPVFYESIIRKPEQEITMINKECALSVPVDRIDFERPSGSDFKQDFTSDTLLQLSRWSDRISNVEKRDLQDVLDFFEIRVYSAFDILPNNSIR